MMHLRALLPSKVPAAGGLVVLAVIERQRRARRLAATTTGVPPGVRTDDGVLLHTETDGPPDAPLTIVFAHGFAARLEEYDAQRSALRGRARLVLFDQRGHGKSGWGDYRSATIDRLGRDLGQVVDAVAAAAPVVLVGHSLGGMAVMALAVQRPELFGSAVVGVALLSTSAGRVALGLPRPVVRLLLRSGVARGSLWLLWLVGPLTDRLSPFRTGLGRRVLRRRLFGRGRPPSWAVSRMQDMWASMSRSMAAAFYPAMIYHDKEEAMGVFRAVPTLVLAGTDDATIPAWHSQRIAAEIGAMARLVRVPGGGHMVNMTHPDAVNDALQDLLTDAERAATPSTGRRGAARHGSNEPQTSTRKPQ